MKADVKQGLNALGMKVANYLNSNRLEHPVNQNIAAMFDYASTPGHKLRSGLVFLAAEAVGGEESKVLPAAAAVELLHKSTLIHDDIVDNDYYRRGMPAFHSKFGEDMGIVFGDFICAASFQLLKRLEGDFDRKTLVRCFGAFSSVFRDVYYGQLQDLQFEEKFDISEAEYMQMVGNKTGRLMNGALQIGAILGNGSDGEISKLSDFGYNFGIAFQIRNDINNLTLEKELRKDGGSDIRARKRTLMVIKTLNSQDKQKLMVIFGKNEIGEEDVNSVIELFNRNGSIKYAFLILKQHAKKAKASLDNLPETRAKESLLSLVDYIETDTYWKTHSRNSY